MSNLSPQDCQQRVVHSHGSSHTQPATHRRDRGCLNTMTYNFYYVFLCYRVINAGKAETAIQHGPSRQAPQDQAMTSSARAGRLDSTRGR